MYLKMVTTQHFARQMPFSVPSDSIINKFSINDIFGVLFTKFHLKGQINIINIQCYFFSKENKIWLTSYKKTHNDRKCSKSPGLWWKPKSEVSFLVTRNKFIVFYYYNFQSFLSTQSPGSRFLFDPLYSVYPRHLRFFVRKDFTPLLAWGAYPQAFFQLSLVTRAHRCT